MRNLIKTFIIAVLVVIIGGQTAQAETKRALLIGISDYGNAMEDPNKWANISGANDVALLSPLFNEQGFKVMSIVDAQATHAGITAALDKLAKDSKKGDVVYIHFSMHGQPFEDLNGDEEDGWDEALIPVDAQMIYSEGIYEGKNHLLDDELEVYFNDIRNRIGYEGKLYVVLDVDNSDGNGFSSTDKQYTPDKTESANNYFKLSPSKELSPVTFIEACLSWQPNKEVRDVNTNIWYGSLSYYIAQALKNHQIGNSEAWIEVVKTSIANNRRLCKQNVVVEKID